ncbi:MAG: hypothetical protein U0Z17_06605 [Bacteroidales bacterium]
MAIENQYIICTIQIDVDINKLATVQTSGKVGISVYRYSRSLPKHYLTRRYRIIDNRTYADRLTSVKELIMMKHAQPYLKVLCIKK